VSELTTTSLPSISVVIPTYEGRDRLLHVLAPLLEDPAASEIIVVVDGSRDGSLELLQEHAAAEPRLKPVFIENRGPSASRQVGVEAATGELVLMLDDDLLAEPGLVARHAGHHVAADGIVVIGYYPSHGQRRRGSFPDEIYADAYRRGCEAYEHHGDEALLHLWGGNVSLRRSDCLRVGVHSDAFYSRYHEDQDFGIRCLQFGLRGVFDRSLRAQHVHSRSIGSFIRDAREDGAGRMLVHLVHSEVVGPLSVSAFAADLPQPARALVRLCRWSPVEAATRRLLLGAIWTAGQLGMFALETNLARLLRRIQQQRGALELLREHGEAPVRPS
jgi:glycosyltransferase involved in cell wall biosynthesis